MKHFVSTAALLIFLALSARAGAQNAGDESVCYAGEQQQYSYDLRIAACSTLIERGNATNSEMSAHLNNRSAAYKAKGMYENALADIDRAIRLDPASARVRAFRADLIGARDPDKAMLDVNEALRLDPSLTYAYRVRGSIRTYKKEFKQALLDHDESVARSPSLPIAYANRAITFEEMGELDLAVLDLNTSLSLNPNYLWALSRRSSIYAQSGRYDLAFADIEQILRLKPDERGSIRIRGIHLYYGTEPAQAVDDFKHLANSSPPNMYDAIWFELVMRKIGGRSELADRRSQYEMSTWPGPILRALLGELTPLQILEFAKNADPKLDRERRCETEFFMAEILFLRSEIEPAKARYKAAHSGCPKTFLEYRAAGLALRRLGESDN